MNRVLVVVAMAGCATVKPTLETSAPVNATLELGQSVSFEGRVEKCRDKREGSTFEGWLAIEPSNGNDHHGGSYEHCEDADSRLAIRCSGPCRVEHGRVQPARLGPIDIYVILKHHWWSEDETETYHYEVVAPSR